MTPETQGGFLNSSFEFQQSRGSQLKGNLENASAEDGVINDEIVRAGFKFDSALSEQFDFFWTHTSGSISLLGLKYQFLGSSRIGNGTGHKMAFSAAMGGNEHETKGENSVKFDLKGKEFQYLYGFRFSEMLMTYFNLSYSKYNFSGVVSSSDPMINQLALAYDTDIYAGFFGIVVDAGTFFGKLECGYQQFHTSYTKDESRFIYGYSIGLSW